MDAHPLPVCPALSDADRATIFAALSDGRRHAFADLAGGSRQGVLDDLATLRSQGMSMELDASSVQAAPFVPLDAAAIARELDCDRHGGSRTSWRVRVAFALGSTNTELLRAVKASDGADLPCILAAECQHAGRGRQGRDWSSAPGASITASFALPIARGIAQLDGVTLACGLAVQRVVASRGVAARLKWPNDVLVDGRKLAGILVEVHGTATGSVLVIGLGINLANTVPRTSRPAALAAASLAEAGITAVDRNGLVAELALALEAHVAGFQREGFGAFVAAWNEVDAFAGHAVRLESPPAAPVCGVARGVDGGGALLLDVGGDRRRIIAGDVSLRPASSERIVA